MPLPAPSPPTWSLTNAQCAHGKTFAGEPAQNCSQIEWNWLGTDDQGRDVVARLIYGFRISVLFGLLLAGISSVVGVAAGAIQGYFGGWTDLLFQRFIEIWSSLPSLYLLIILSAIVAPSFFVLLFILLAFSWVNLVHVVRAEFLRARNFDYVRAARALGLSNRKIMVKHVLPNAMVATLTFLPFILNSSITTLTSLDFLGFGLPPGSPSLGELLLQGKSNLQAPWLGLSGFAVIAVTLRCWSSSARPCATPSIRERASDGPVVTDAVGQDAPLLEITDLSVGFGPTGRESLAVESASLRLERGRTLGLVGESGSGKSVTALAIVRLLAPGAKILGGSIRFQGRELLGADEAVLRDIRGARIAMVFQEPMTSLNPLHRIEKQIGEILEIHGMFSRDEAARRGRWSCCAKSGCKTPSRGSTPFRMNCPAASASA